MEKYIINKNRSLLEIAKENKKAYKDAVPFPNCSFKNFFDEIILERILNEFPDLSKGDSVQFANNKEKKFAGQGEHRFGEETKKLMRALNSQPFLEFLQELTGIKETLIGDPYFFGGGLHEIKSGGLLKVHADFNKMKDIGLDRRINVLIYLNKDWKEEYGGHFELWDKSMTQCVKKILPTFNTMAIFSTTDFSYHGHPNPLNCPLDRSRKSLALYYYTNGRPKAEINETSPSHGTIFKERIGKDDFKENTERKQTKRGKEIKKFKKIIKDFIPPILLKIKRKYL